MDIYDNDYKKLKNIINKKVSNKNYELEVRLCGNIFNNKLNNVILNRSEFKRILELLIFSKENNGHNLSYEISKSLDINYNNNNRITIDGIDNIKKYFVTQNLLEIKNYKNITKKFIDNLDILDYSLRISLADETESNNNNNDINNDTTKYFRFKNRYSIISFDKLFRYDLSEVKMSDGFNIKDSNVFKKEPYYEIEIEYIGDLKDNDEIIEHLIKNIGFILKLYQNNNYIISKSDYDLVKQYYFNIVSCQKFVAANPVTLHQKNLLNNKKYININKNYAVTYKADGERYFGIVYEDGMLYLLNNNYNIIKTNIQNKSFIGTLIECEYVENNNLILAYDILYHKKTNCHSMKLIPNRVNLIEKFIKDCKSDEEFTITFKEHKTSSNIYDTINELLDNSNKLDYNVDGLIFTPIEEKYPSNGGTWFSLFKWKPENLNTIDFLIEFVKDNNLDLILTEKKNGQYVKYKQCKLLVSGFREKYNNKINKREKTCVPIEFKPINEDIQIANLIIEDENVFAYDELSDTKEIIENDTIIEFRYDTYETNELFRWKPVRNRYDKTLKYKNGETMFGNFENVANDIWKNIKNPITEKLIRTGDIDENNIINNENEEYYSSLNSNSNPQNRISYQKFHTIFVKTNGIKKITSLLSEEGKKTFNLFDIGFGKLGDLPNWTKNKINYIFGVDVNSNNLDNSLQIYKEQPSPKPKIILALADFGKLIFPNFDCAIDIDSKKIMKKQLNSKYQFDIITSQFSLTYFYKDEITLRTFFQNVNDNLKIGGYFLANCFDGESVIKFLDKNKSKEGKLNEKLIWKIEKNYRNGKFDFEKPLYGKEITVFISSIGKSFKENLVNFTYFKTLALEYNLDVIDEIQFDSLFSEMSNKKNFNNITSAMTDVEKEFSFLNKQIILKKQEHSPVKLLTKLQNKIKKTQKD